MRTFKVYFADGNQRLYKAPHIAAVVRYVSEAIDNYGVTDIVKIEEVQG